MRIAIVGAHQVGKTTLAEELLENLPGYTLEIEPYHELEAAGFEFSNLPGTEDYLEQFNFSVRQVSRGGINVILIDAS